MLPTKKCHLSDETETIIKDWTKFKNANEHALSHHDHSYQHCLDLVEFVGTYQNSQNMSNKDDNTREQNEELKRENVQYKRALDAANEEIRHLYSQQAADKAMVQAYKQELDQYKERFIAAAKNAVQEAVLTLQFPFPNKEEKFPADKANKINMNEEREKENQQQQSGAMEQIGNRTDNGKRQSTSMMEILPTSCKRTKTRIEDHYNMAAETDEVCHEHEVPKVCTERHRAFGSNTNSERSAEGIATQKGITNLLPLFTPFSVDYNRSSNKPISGTTGTPILGPFTNNSRGRHHISTAIHTAGYNLVTPLTSRKPRGIATAANPIPTTNAAVSLSTSSAVDTCKFGPYNQSVLGPLFGDYTHMERPPTTGFSLGQLY